MSNRKYVCFDCRLAFRREANSETIVKCSSCGKPCINIGYKIPLPAKDKIKEWQSLETQITLEEHNHKKYQSISNVSKKHELEKEIQKLEQLPDNDGRKVLIKKLNKQLAAINA